MDSQDKNIMFFIITEKHETQYSHLQTGRICHMLESRYMFKIKTNETVKKLPVTCMDSTFEYELEVSKLEPVTIQQAELMQALETNAERLKWFREKEALLTAQGLTENTAVTVELNGKWLRGIIRYIGNIVEKMCGNPITGTFFGIELQGNDRGKGHTDGMSHYRTLFSCKKDCGVFAPFSRVRPVVPSSLSPTATAPPPLRPLPTPQSLADVPTPLSNTDVLTIGDRVTFYPNDCDFGRHGMVMDLEERDGQQIVHISTDTDEKGMRGGEVSVPLDCVIKGEVLPAGSRDPEPDYMDVVAPPDAPKLERHPSGLDVGSLVEVNMASDNCYGKVRWIGNLPDRRETMAGLELEMDIGLSDGTFKGERFFSCPTGRALFVKLLSCRPDSRSHRANHSEPTGTRANHSERTGTSREKEKERSTERLEKVPPISSEDVGRVLIGRMRGIQGHCNSCYMDAALFSLFSCSSVLDSLLFKSTEPRDAPIQDTLLYDIVNPLRSKGFVEGRHIMKLRQQLQEHGYSHSFTTEEKDPEEFLTVIMHHILSLDPLLKLSAGGKVQDSYCYQIFLDQSHSLVLPTVQQLLEHSFHGAGLKLAEIPSCLILQMPRFGKKFKMFDKIIPSLQLDITDLLTEGPQQCVLCGQLAREECGDCFRDPVFSTAGFKLFCTTCSHQVHSHPQRRAHRPAALQVPEGFRLEPHVLARERLELFAVLCIETSHYVSFLKYGPNKQDWIFFDSMADRHGERDGFNIPQVQACPEVGVYLDLPPVELANLVPRDMKGVAKRLFCDAYMYLYQSTTMSLYR